MFEIDEATKLRTLHGLGFDVDNLNVDKIVFVPMHRYKVSSEKEEMLYVFGLQCCVGVYAYSNNWGFASHINTKVMRGDDYQLDSNKNPIRCSRIDDLKREILSRKIIDEPVKIGVALSDAPLSKFYPTMRMVYEGIDILIKELSSMGIEAEQLEDITAPEFLLSIEEGKIIAPYFDKKNLK